MPTFTTVWPHSRGDRHAGRRLERRIPVADLQGLADYWRSRFDWRTEENTFKTVPQFTTTVDGQNLHCLHVRSAEPIALPLLLAHGYPTSAFEFLRIIPPANRS